MKKNHSLYNIALDCVDDKAANPLFANRAALAFVSGNIASGETEHGVKITYRNLKNLTDRAAHVFKRAGLKPKERILIRLPNIPEFPIAFFGAIKAGLLPVPVSLLMTQTELSQMATHSNARAIVTVPDVVARKLASKKKPPLCFFVAEKSTRLPKNSMRLQEAMLKESGAFRVKPTALTDPAYCLYTSGTTGISKAVVHAHGSIPGHDDRVLRWLDFQAGDVVFNTGSLSWSYGLTCGLLDVLRHGGTSLIYDGPPDAANLLHFINRYGVTTLMSVPALYKRLTDYLSSHYVALASLCVCLSAADTISESLMNDFLRLTGRHIYQGFGMTEHSVYVFQPFGEPISHGTIGKPSDPKKVKILNAKGSEAPVNEVGVMAIRGNSLGLMLGFQEANKINLPLVNGWFLSGDVAFRDAQGDFHFCGRADDMLNIGGFRVSPIEIENVLARHPAIRDAAVVGVKMKSGGTATIAVLVVAPKFKKSAKLKSAVLTYLARYLAPYKVPKRIEFVPRLPRTANGKLKRSALVKRLK